MSFGLPPNPFRKKDDSNPQKISLISASTKALDYYDSEEDVKLSPTNIFHLYKAGNIGPAVVLMHGGGHTSLVWSIFVKQAKSFCSIYAFDFRGHGKTRTDNDLDLSIDTMSNDSIEIIKKVVPSSKKLIIIGHSMGGAVAVHTCKKGEFSNLKGLIVVDVVEGTAIPALGHMTAILTSRPSSFSCNDEAIDWAVSSANVRTRESARISIPDQIIKKEDGKYHWITDLKSSEPYWLGWYKGLSDLFISVNATKMLLLAGTDRLDKPLTIGQMQGKYQLVIIPGSGHSIHEDVPEEFTRNIYRFLSRYGFLEGGDDELKRRLEQAQHM